MGAIKGSISYALFEVEGAPVKDFDARAIERLQEYRFQALTPEHEEDARSGWCVMHDMLDTDFDKEKVVRGDYLCFGLRTDRWSLPSALLKALIAREEDAIKEKTGRNRLFKSERETIREAQTRALKQQLIPTPNSVDVVWNTRTQQLRIWTLSPARLDTFNELFVPTFGSEFELRLVRRRPYSAAVAAGLNADQLATFDTLNRFMYHA